MNKGKFSEFVISYDNNIAGDRYSELPDISKRVIDAAIERYIKIIIEQGNSDAVEFAEWMHEKRYAKYWGGEGENCGKWYIMYTPPGREYFTGEELYKLFKQSKL